MLATDSDRDTVCSALVLTMGVFVGWVAILGDVCGDRPGCLRAGAGAGSIRSGLVVSSLVSVVITAGLAVLYQLLKRGWQDQAGWSTPI